MSALLFKRFRVLDMSPATTTPASGHRVHCCDDMRAAVLHVCEDHPDKYDCADALVTYVPVFDEYGLIIHDGGAGYLLIRHCPWCGARLPESKRDRYFDRLAELGLGETSLDNLPDAYKTDFWWNTDDHPANRK